jgi:hypothetical protein
MYEYDTEKFSLVHCQETQEYFGIRNVYKSAFDLNHKEGLFPCHKFNPDGTLEDTPTVFKKRSLLQISSGT